MKISVITATYNVAGTVQDCLDSVRGQGHGNVEHVVVDGASSDGTVELLEGHRDRIDRFVSEPDRGIYDALNKGVAMASGDVVGFLHADDVFSGSSVLSRVAGAFADDAVGAVYGDLQYVKSDDIGGVIRHWRSGEFVPARLRWGWMPPHPTLYVRRSWYERLGGFDLGYSIAADYQWMLRLLSQDDLRVAYIPEVLVKMRVGGASNRSLKNIVRKSREDLRAMRETGVGALGGVGALVWKNVSKVGQFVKRR
ncbi:glycosyltransferase [Wenzhouxiangella sp. XN79A]|uniref:glycosyltransferase n=1 Tax=Wenzhouxiangella sp. XN79A TaxID=2724193 RepID=UPI00144AD4B1|nr:glycosyltransferase [Wenzhouxiangella sp. XN79A]